MFGKQLQKPRRNKERGATLIYVAVSLFVLMGMGALAIDLVSLYAARSEAQRAADAAALAGAKEFIDSGFISGLVSQSTAQTLATQDAIIVGAENLIGGQAAAIQSSDITFNFSVPENPQITVTVQRTAARGNALPTFFAKAMRIGMLEADVTATATAEAFNPSGGNLPLCAGCIKPWILPNCDPDPAHGGSDTSCDVNYVNETTGDIVYPGAYPSGVIGQSLVLKWGDPQDAAAPSQFFPIQIPPGEEPALCPTCAQNTGSLGPGAALYARNIACCNTNQVVCGQEVDVQLNTGNMVGPSRMGVECLIHQLPNQTGQDILDTSSVPFQITGGSNHPNPYLRGQIISSSDAIVTIPLYDGHDLCPGGSCNSTVIIVGFLQIFITNVEKAAQGKINGVILNVAGCGGGGGGGGSSSGCGGGGSGGGSDSGGPVSGGSGSLFPVRLVRGS
ncbi:MAG: hypothetical protein IH846_09835 [Acidobacteria bacterium]|nr:hypothetical protein [Acidobacteriota bacterium]